MREINDSWAEQQAIISIFGADGINHTVEKLQTWQRRAITGARDIGKEDKSSELEYNEEIGEAKVRMKDIARFRPFPKSGDLLATRGNVLYTGLPCREMMKRRSTKDAKSI